MPTFLLLIWVGGHSGYLAVPGISSEQECHALAATIANDAQGFKSFAHSSNHSCVRYQAARH